MDNDKDFDTAMVGTGPANICAVLGLKDKKYKGSIVLFDQGRRREISHLDDPSHVGIGWGGAGGISDGKFNLTKGQGGDYLRELIGEDRLYDLLNELILPKYLQFFGSKDYKETITPNDHWLISRAEKEGMVLLLAHIVHFGTDGSHKIMETIYNHLREQGVKIKLGTNIKSVESEGDRFVLTTSKGEQYHADNVVLGAGRTGNSWQAKQFHNMGVKILSNGTTAGFRYELESRGLEELINNFHESKFILDLEYTTPSGLQVVRAKTYCMSPGGYVINEGGQPNGESLLYQKSDNTNVAIVVTLRGIENPDKYLRELKSKPMSVYGKPIVFQTYSDFVNRVPTTALPTGGVRPTLNERYFTFGDLNEVLPPEICEAGNLLLEKIGNIINEFTLGSNLLYGNETKQYSLQTETIVEEKDGLPLLRTAKAGAYGVGDASLTEGFSLASLSGYLAGVHIAITRPA